MNNEKSPLISTETALPPVSELIRRGKILSNAGSTARDHLANERTYLAWMRTGLALFGASIGLLKWQDISNVAAYLVAILGATVLLMSTHRYFRVMQLLEQGKFEPNIHGALFVVAVSLLGIVTAFVMHINNKL